MILNSGKEVFIKSISLAKKAELFENKMFHHCERNNINLKHTIMNGRKSLCTMYLIMI